MKVVCINNKNNEKYIKTISYFSSLINYLFQYSGSIKEQLIIYNGYSSYNAIYERLPSEFRVYLNSTTINMLNTTIAKYFLLLQDSDKKKINVNHLNFQFLVFGDTKLNESIHNDCTRLFQIQNNNTESLHPFSNEYKELIEGLFIQNHYIYKTTIENSSRQSLLEQHISESVQRLYLNFPNAFSKDKIKEIKLDTLFNSFLCRLIEDFNAIYKFYTFFINYKNCGGKIERGLEYLCQIFPHNKRIQEIIPSVKITEKDKENKKQNFFGIELEFSSKISIKDLIMNTNKDKWYFLKHDGTITGRYTTTKAELVTVPMTYNAAKYYFGRFFKTYPAINFDNTLEQDNGIHIHSSVNNFVNSLHKINFVGFFINYANFLFIKLLSERPEDKLTYCAFPYNYSTIRNIRTRQQEDMQYLSQLGRHRKIIEETNTTVEVRCFKGYSNYFTVIKALEFVNAILNYTKIHSTNKKISSSESYARSINLEEFINWLNTTGTFEYRSLKKVLKNNKDELKHCIDISKFLSTTTHPKLFDKNIMLSNGEFESNYYQNHFASDYNTSSFRITPGSSLSDFIKKRIESEVKSSGILMNEIYTKEEINEIIKGVNDYFNYEAIDYNARGFLKFNKNKLQRQELIISSNELEQEYIRDVLETNDMGIEYETPDPRTV